MTYSVGTRRLVLAASIIASSMGFIDGSGLTVALPAMRQDLGADLSSLQWVLNIYVLALAALSLVGGAIADAKGRVRVLIAGVMVFGAASAWCALSSSIGSLIIARGVQGVGAAFMTPASLALIGSVYPKDQRGGAIGVWAAASALMTSAGPPLGGWLTESFGWPAVFWINPPLALLAIAILLYAGPRTPRKDDAPFDTVGAIFLAIFLAALAAGLSALGGEEGPLPISPALAFLVAALGFGLFFVRQTRASAPMMPPSIFRNRTFAGLNLATLFLYAALSIVFFQLPFTLIERLGLSASMAGMAFLPFTLGVGFLSNIAGGLMDKTGPRLPLVSGAGLAAVAFAWMAMAAESTLLLGALLPMGVLGLAFALLIAPLTAGVMASLGDEDQGLASGVNNTVSRIAQLIGVAAAAALGSTLVSFQTGTAMAAGLAVLAAIAAAFGTKTAPAPSAAD
ncbi:MAG: MFS transporter [Pseudomonadota bacterium]